MLKVFSKIVEKSGFQYHKVIEQDGSSVASMRWGKLCWDFVRHKDGRRFVQYGSNPVKFIATIPVKTQIFLFLKQTNRWVVYKKIARKKCLFMFGYTTRPLSLCTIKRPANKMKPRRGECRGLVEHLS